MAKYILIILGCILKTQSLSGQCPERTFLWNRITYLRDSSSVSSMDQIRELKTYLNNINDCSYQNDSTHVLLLSRTGWLFSKQSDFKSAIIFTNRAIDMIHAHIDSKNIKQAQLIRCYNNLRILYDSTNQETLKNRAIDSCISLVIRLKTDYNYAFEIVNLKIARYFEKGDYFNCISYSNLGEFIASKAGYLEQDALYYKTWKINSLIYLYHFQDASILIENSIRECIQKRNNKYLGSLLGLKAVIAIENNQAGEAIKFINQSVKYNKSIHNYSGCAGALINIGYNLFYKKLLWYDKAITSFTQALSFASNDEAITILGDMGTIYTEMGDYDKAFDFFQQSFDRIYPGANEKNILNRSGEEILNKVNAEYIVKLELNKAYALIKKYNHLGNRADLNSALLVYKCTDRLMQKIKLVQTGLASKLFWRNETISLYEHAIESCYLLGNMEDAFYFFEKSRAVLLNDQLKEQETGDPLMQEMAIAKKRVLILEKQNANLVPSSPEYSRVQRELFINKEQISRLDQEIKAKNPWYYQSLIDTNFISLHEVKSKLLGNKGAKAFMEFFNGDSSVYVLTVTAGNSKVSRIRKTDFENAVNSYIRYVSNSTMENQDYTGFINTGRLLYSLIFKDAPVPDGRIIISPDGKYFPLEALITNQNNPTPEYFLNSHIISYTYSIRYLLNDFTKKSSSSAGNFLGMAPVQYPEAFQLASLSRSDASLEKISLNFKDPELKIGPQATRSQFMRLFQNFKIIQLYTHASDSSSNDEPVIYFADSGLYLSELIPENKTAAQLIVLSACETGNGKLYKGEGVFSFNRGFAALGIPSSVINLWSVDDESTYKLTELFYKYVRKGLPLDEALQKAKLDFFTSSSKEKKLPYFWAATILAGKTDPIVTTHGIPWGLIVDFGLIGLFVFGFILVKRKSKKSKTPDHFQHSII